MRRIITVFARSNVAEGLTLPNTIKAGERGLFLSIGNLRELHEKGEFQESLPSRSNQWMSYAPKHRTFKEANPANNGEYNVSYDPYAEQHHVIKLPKTALGPKNKEIIVADSHDIALSLVLDEKTTMRVEYDEPKRTYEYHVNDTSAWFAVKIPTGSVISGIALAPNGAFVRAFGGKGTRFKRAEGMNWNGLLAYGAYQEKPLTNERGLKWTSRLPIIDASIMPSRLLGLLSTSVLEIEAARALEELRKECGIKLASQVETVQRFFDFVRGSYEL